MYVEKEKYSWTDREQENTSIRFLLFIIIAHIPLKYAFIDSIDLFFFFDSLFLIYLALYVDDHSSSFLINI